MLEIMITIFIDVLIVHIVTALRRIDRGTAMESKHRCFLATIALVLLLAGQANGVCIPGGEAHAHAAH